MALRSSKLSRALAFGLRWLTGAAAIVWHWRLLRRQARWSRRQLEAFAQAVSATGGSFPAQATKGCRRLGPLGLLAQLGYLADDEAAAWAKRLKGLKADLLSTSDRGAHPRDREYLAQASARQLQAKLTTVLFTQAFRHRPAGDQVAGFELYQHSSEAFADFLECCEQWGLLDSRESALAGIEHFGKLVRELRDKSRRQSQVDAGLPVVVVRPRDDIAAAHDASPTKRGDADSARKWSECLPTRRALVEAASKIGIKSSPPVPLLQRGLPLVYWGKDHSLAAQSDLHLPEWVAACLDAALGMAAKDLQVAAAKETGRVQELDRASVQGVLTHALAVQACGLVCAVCVGLPESDDPQAAAQRVGGTFALLLLGAHSFATTGRDPESAPILGAASR